MLPETMLNVSICAILLVFLVRFFAYTPPTNSFPHAVLDFTFNVFSFRFSLLLIYIFSIIIPFSLLSYALYTSELSFKAALHHIFHCYLALCIIYCFNLFEDYFRFKTVLKESSHYSNSKGIFQTEDYNEWHKYILHFFLTPILFFDTVYSFEAKKHRHVRDKSKKDLLVQVVVSLYLLHVFHVILYLNNIIPDIYLGIYNSKSIECITILPVYIKDFSRHTILCIFTAFLAGFIGSGSPLLKIMSIFRIYVDWAI